MSQEIQFCSDANVEPMVSSREVAAKFEKEHKHVLRDVRDRVLPFISEHFSRSNFELATYEDEQGKPRQEYLMTKDGFMILAMGFTGEEAMRWKEAFIDAFNKAIGSVAELRKELARKEAVILKLQRKKQHRYLVPSSDHLEGFDPPLVMRDATDLSPEEMRKAKQAHVVKTMKGLMQKHILERTKAEKAEILGALLQSFIE
jgi:Rha family phage regulatory protein